MECHTVIVTHKIWLLLLFLLVGGAILGTRWVGGKLAQQMMEVANLSQEGETNGDSRLGEPTRAVGRGKSY